MKNVKHFSLEKHEPGWLSDVRPGFRPLPVTIAMHYPLANIYYIP
jgi:hypothetical protein